ncbi:MAG: PAS domain-containing protein [Verrucomicrobiales bacterium]
MPRPPRILIAEDEGIVGMDVRATLARLGYEVVEAVRSGQDAVAAAEAQRPDLVLMDIKLAGPVDGIDAARQIAERGVAPVVFMTGYSDDAMLARAREARPYGYLIKPFNALELRSAVEVALTRHAEQARAQDRLGAVCRALDSLADAVIAADLAGTVTFLNAPAEEITGWRAADAIGQPLAKVYPLTYESGESAPPLGSHPAAPGGRQVFLANRSGGRIAVEDNAAPIRAADGSLDGLVIAFRISGKSSGTSPAENDLTKRNKSPDRPWAHLVGILESIGDPLIAVDARWRITYANARAADHFGKARDSLIGSGLWDEFPKEAHSDHYDQYYRALLRGEPRAFEFHDRAAGQWFDVQAYPFAAGLLIFFRDITGRKQAEEERGKVEKLESLGLLARGFAHDFNNLLTILLGNLALAERRIPKDANFRAEIEVAKGATAQAQSLVQQLLTFAKGGAPIKRAGPLRSPSWLVGDYLKGRQKWSAQQYVVDALAGCLAADIETRTKSCRLLENCCATPSRRSRLDRSGGKVTVRVQRVDAALPSPDGAASGEGESDAEAYLAIQADNYRGIPKAVLNQVFEPFFSTRSGENATGIGLTVRESIARFARRIDHAAQRRGNGRRWRRFTSRRRSPQPASPPATRRRRLGAGANVVEDGKGREPRRTAPHSGAGR